MNPEQSLRLGVAGTLESLRTSIRRGRLLLIILAVVTGGALLASSLHDYLHGQAPGGLSDLLVGWALIGWICWCVVQGGKLSAGCLLFLAIPVLLGLMLGTLALVFNLIVPGGTSSAGVGSFQGIGSDRAATLAFIPFGAWAVYTVWVLLISRDVRLYREARRRGIAGAEAVAFDWPPASRRPQ